ncbi:MAG: N-acetyl-gamma-glutamyl-phosphate reductase [Pseudomonadota bacterium]|nr:N-acetyl-gamma-glutamyl-phosphate reductase [Pseudomonadota bacterium]MED5274680.1 N-acetyl-gamma-glutamyl-phosphate reductase [Pseudomonadota bacterium]
MLSVGIVGASGYTGEELTKLLQKHPKVEITALTSRTHVGKKINEVFTSVKGINSTFLQPNIKSLKGCDVVFFATPNGIAMNMAEELLENNIRIIDISADFRLRDAKAWEEWYEMSHSAKSLLEESVYGLPEIPNQKDKIVEAKIVANPGCYPTAAILALLPIFEKLKKQKIIIDAKSGISGAGRNLNTEKLFSPNEENFQPYAVQMHRHYPEILQTLNDYNSDLDVLFVPHLSSMNRGILSTLYVNHEFNSIDDLQATYVNFFSDSPFIKIAEKNSFPRVSSVNGTNDCVIALHQSVNSSKEDVNLVIFSAIDNLIKGASGQAVQNMNIMFGIDESTGLL